jgi:ADP-ribosyl-[dinitrogen reductase] hydrolase
MHDPTSPRELRSLALLARLHDIPMTIGRASYVRDDGPLSRESIFQDIPRAEKDAVVADGVRDGARDRAVGCIVGMAIGDALGHPLEFLPAVDPPATGAPSFDRRTLTYAAALNEFDLKPGQWSDDASMGLCLADSLIVRRGYDGSDLRARFWNWWFRGYNNSFRFDPTRSVSVGLGGNISDSLFALKPGVAPPPRYEAGTRDAGNGSIMRLAAVPVFFHRDVEEAARVGAESSRATHPGAVATEACTFLSWLLARAIGSDEAAADARRFLDRMVDEYLVRIDARIDPGVAEVRALLASRQPDDGLERNWNWRADSLELVATIARRGEIYNGYPVLAEYFGSYCLDGLAMALHAVYHSGSFGEAIERCVNFLGDADSTGAVAGQIAGAIYGYRSIDPRIIANLWRWDDGEIALRGVILYDLGEAR